MTPTPIKEGPTEIPGQTSKQHGSEKNRQQGLSTNYELHRIITRIHDVYYDLTDFNHPGGPIAVASIDNRDGTELFESHHLFSKRDIKGMLKKYEISP